jgi:putative transposase
MLRITLNDTQKAELRQGARQSVGRISERFHFVLLSAQGYSPPAIGQLMGYDAQTIRMWLRAYQQKGGAGLWDAPRSGRPREEPYLTAVVQAQASQPPPNSGYLQACWTVALLVLHLAQRFRIQVSLATLRRSLHQAGFRWKRPKLAPARRQDPHAEAKQARIAEVLAEPEATLIAEDECDLHLLAVLRAMWQRLGEQVRVFTPGQNAKRGVFGALNLRTGEWFYHLTDHKRSGDFIALLAHLLEAYSLGMIYVLVDNASIHTSLAVRQWLEHHPRLELVYLPTYSGHQLNPVEKVWWALKGEIAANRCFKSLADLDVAVRRFFTQFSPSDALALANSPTVRTALASAQK